MVGLITPLLYRTNLQPVLTGRLEGAATGSSAWQQCMAAVRSIAGWAGKFTENDLMVTMLKLVEGYSPIATQHLVERSQPYSVLG